MSEYAAGFNNPTSRKVINEDAYLENVEGTLFELLNEQDPVADSTKRRLGASAALASGEGERTPQYTYPETVEHWQGLPAPVDDEPNSQAYHELGGVRGVDTGLYEVLQRYEPWMRDMSVGIERYGLLEMTRDDVAKMTVDDKDILSLYVDGYYEGNKSVRRLISSHEGDVTGHDFLKKYIHDGVRPTPAQMLQYGKDLAVFEQHLTKQGAYPALVKYAQDKRGGDTEWGRSQRHKTRRDNKTKKKNTPAVRHDNDVRRPKWRVELLPYDRQD